mgnify:CR=1 FL=1
MNVLDGTLSTSLLFRMADIYVAIAANQGDITALVEQGQVEEQWVGHLEQMCRAYHRRGDWNPNILDTLLDMLISTWPPTLTQRLTWGPMPHYGALGGVSGFRMEAALDQLDYVVAETVQRTGRTIWTDLAWQRIARLGIVQRKCPDCGQSGPQGQMAYYGAIYACGLCEGVTWSAPVYN